MLSRNAASGVVVVSKSRRQSELESPHRPGFFVQRVVIKASKATASMDAELQLNAEHGGLGGESARRDQARNTKASMDAESQRSQRRRGGGERMPKAERARIPARPQILRPARRDQARKTKASMDCRSAASGVVVVRFFVQRVVIKASKATASMDAELQLNAEHGVLGGESSAS